MSSREEKHLSVVTFKKLAGTGVIQCGWAAESPLGSVTVAESRGWDSSRGLKKWVGLTAAAG